MCAARQLGLLLIVGIFACTGGCASSKTTFLSARCEDHRDGTRLKELVFVSTLQVTRLKNEQLVYQVRLFDRERAPLRSRDGRYQTEEGIVAASTTIMVLQSPQTFKNMRVSIPAQELQVPPNPVPAFAEIAILKAGGEIVTRVWRTVPALRMTEIMPPLATTPAPVPYWFVPVTDPRRLPILLGPFVSLEEAEAAVTEETGPPRQINSDAFLWFVPVYGLDVEQKATLIGPLSCEADAQDVVELVVELPELAPKGLVTGAPLEVQVRQWLKEREVSRIVSSRPAEPEPDEKAPAGRPGRDHL